MSIYFGGSRNLKLSAGTCNHIFAIVNAVQNAGHKIHVGCQYGADQAVVMSSAKSSLVVFAVAPNLAASPAHVQHAASHGAISIMAAGGTNAPIKARYLLRSIAAFQGCSQAVFFSPGSGSLAVAREFIKSRISQNLLPLVFAFQQEPPAPVPSVSGQWVQSSFFGFSCWQWQAPTQPALF